ncbi:MAG TPA: hypothetical protein VG871_14400 [Vicinamibacterales bacterium]|nr:hypothetical protein [Vicinamibacterales bacterium]
MVHAGKWMTAAMVASALGAFASPARGQGEAIRTAKPAPTASKPAPRTAAGRISLSGIWSPDRNFIYDINGALAKGDTLPIQPWALKTTLARGSKDDPEANCLPTGVPRQAPYPWRIVQTPALVFFLFEGNIHSYRQIFMDGRGHPADLDPTWYGHSIGTWDGDTLVVDSVGFNDRFWFDFAGHPHTEQLHVVERFSRPDFDHLAYDVTIDDPGAYTRPFTLHGKSVYQHGTELMEYICNENNQDVSHIVGKDPRNIYAK